MSGVVLLNLLSIFLTKSSLKLSVSSTIQTSIILYSLSPIVVYFHGHCSKEIKNIIPNPVRRIRATRSSTYSHPCQVTLPNARTLSHKSSFIPRTSQLWNSLPPTTFHESYILSSCKSNINKLDLVSLSTYTSPPFLSFSFVGTLL